MSSQIAFPAQIGNGAEEVERLNACALLGRQDLVPYYRSLASEGTGLMQNVVAGSANWGTGEIQLGTGATINTTAGWITGSTGGNFATSLRAAGDFYMSGRFRAVTTPLAGTIISIGGIEATFSNFFRVGLNQLVSASFFSVNGSGGLSLVSAVAIDTVVHTFRCWRVGSTTFFQIDGGAVVSSGTTAWAGSLCPCLLMFCGTAADQRGGFQWFFVATPPV